MTKDGVGNLVHIANRRIDILNERLDGCEASMYPVPSEPSREYVRVMVSDLDWLMESVEPEVGRESEEFEKYIDVRRRLLEVHERLRPEGAAV